MAEDLQNIVFHRAAMHIERSPHGARKNAGLTSWLRTFEIGQVELIPIENRSAVIVCAKQAGMKFITQKYDETRIAIKRLA